MAKGKVLLLGPLPPPSMGPTLATGIILRSSLKEEFNIIHLDTSDHRGLESLGAVDARNVLLAFRHLGALAAAALRDRPDLVYVPVSQTTLGFFRDGLFILAARLLGRRVVCHLRGGGFRLWMDRSPPAIRGIVRRILGLTRGMIVVGEAIRPQFEGYVDDARVYVVPNGADYHFTPPRRRPGPGLKLLFLSNLQPSKGLEDVLAALELVVRKVPEGGVSLDVVGSWPDEETRERCLEFCRQRALPVTFHPAAGEKEKFAFFGQAEVFVFTPREPEGHPWVLNEAMAAALPVIAARQGAIGEIVEEGRNGFLVPPNRPDETAAKIHTLLADPQGRLRMGEESLARYRERFTEARMTGALGDAFREVMKD